MQENLVPIKKAMLWLLLSTLLISGTGVLALLYYKHVRDLYANDDTYRIVAILQATSDKEALNTAYLAELLSLSVDQPSNLYRFNSKEARRKLLANPLFKEANVKKIRPGMVFVDYALRQPMAFLLDFTNTAIDADWVTLPFKPFFTPKKLPEIYLGISENCESSPISGGSWGTSPQGPRVNLAKQVFQHVMSLNLPDNVHLRRIDVSNAFAPSYGNREIIVIFEEGLWDRSKENPILVNSQRVLRLNTEQFVEGISNYIALQSQLAISPLVIDLRLSQLAYIQVVK